MTYHPTMWERIQKARLNVESDNLVPRFLYIKSFREKNLKLKSYVLEEVTLAFKNSWGTI